MEYYNDTDIGLTDEGDLELDETGDFGLSVGFDCTADDIAMIVPTQKNDSDVYPDLGADLEELIGMPNTREVGMEGQMRILDALTDAGVAYSDDLKVLTIPAGDEIIYYIIIEREKEEQVAIEYPLKLNFGGSR